MSSSQPYPPETTSSGDDAALAVAFFAGIMLVTLGLLQLLAGIAAVADDALFVVGSEYVFAFDVTTWGWIHIVVAVVGIAVGVGILTGRTWALVAGVVIAVISAVSNFLFLPFYPFWSAVLLAFDALVIWALSERISHHYART